MTGATLPVDHTRLVEEGLDTNTSKAPKPRLKSAQGKFVILEPDNKGVAAGIRVESTTMHPSMCVMVTYCQPDHKLAAILVVEPLLLQS